ncbi:MAG: RtcB family protein [Thermoleophilaceae bacterium]|nr:RtcB family protein [Thermoleophilaceae bacterium]
MSTTTTNVGAEAPGLRIFDSAEAPADPVGLAAMREGLADADLAAPPAVLPDFHFKGDKEMPSSIAVATRDTIRPTLTSCSLNCGMALVALDLERPDEGRISAFYDRVRERLPFPPPWRRDLTPGEVVRCAGEGARFAVERFAVDPAVLARIEEGGRLDTEPYGGIERIRRELPWSVKQASRLRFANIGPSNHFIELQQVEEVLDPEAAALLGVEAGQVTLQYHGGGGALTGELGVLFGPRKRYTRQLRIQMAVQRPLYHFARARSLEELRLRKRLYFSGEFRPVERDGGEGERLTLANVMAMNYGFAFRVAVYAILTRLAAQTLGATGSRLIVDSPHNSIYEEEIDGETAVVHRHNAARAYPASRMAGHPVFGKIGQALLLPGTNRTSSYLCVAGEGARDSVYSACHGAGSSIKHFVERGLSGSDPRGRTTLRFDYSRGGPTEVGQLDDRGVDDALGTLVRHDIARPVARLRPIAVLN